MVRPRTASFGSLELMDTHFSMVFLSFSLLVRFVCAFTYFSCSRKISQGWIDSYSQAMVTDQLGWVCADSGGPAVVILSAHGWIVSYSQAMATDQLVWVYADGGDPVVVILLVSWCWIVCRRGTVMRHFLCGLSAIWSVYFF